MGARGRALRGLKEGKRMSTASKLARRFHQLVREHLAEHLEEIDRVNADYGVEGPICATHDYCDANDIMADAFESVVGREDVCSSSEDAALWSEAWAIAKRHGFSKEWTNED